MHFSSWNVTLGIIAPSLDVNSIYFTASFCPNDIRIHIIKNKFCIGFEGNTGGI